MNRRQVLFGIGAAGAVGATGYAVFAAAQSRTPAQRAALAAPPSPSIVTVPVRRGELIDELRMEGKLERAENVSVAAPASVVGATRLVVTKVNLKVGGLVRDGQLLTEVSGRPVIALSGAFPAYRELARGMTGTDVGQLQQGLRKLYGTPRTGRFDLRTEADLARLYRRCGYQPLTKMVSLPASAAGGSSDQHGRRLVLPVGEIAFLPQLPAQVTTIKARVGAEATGSLMVVASGTWQVVVNLDGESEKALTTTKPTEVTMGGGPAIGRPTILVEIRDASEQPQGEQPTARQAVFAVDGALRADVGSDQQVLLTRARGPKNALIVPITALNTAADGTVTVTVLREGAQVPTKVEVGMTVLGECVVTGAVQEGDLVVVSDN